MKEIEDNLEQRCPRLGGRVSLRYCKTGGDERSICWKIFDCWWERFDVKDYLKNDLSAEKYNILVDSKPKPKVVTLVELVEKAKERVL
jgi:hypothetical protein